MADDPKKKKKVDDTTGNRGEKPGKLGYFTEKSISKFDPMNNPYTRAALLKNAKPDTIATDKTPKPAPFKGGASSYQPRAAARDTSPVGVPKSTPKPTPKIIKKPSAKQKPFPVEAKPKANTRKLNADDYKKAYSDAAKGTFNDMLPKTPMDAALDVASILPVGRVAGAAGRLATRALPMLERAAPGVARGIEQIGGKAMKALSGGKPGENIRIKPGQPTYRVGNTATKVANKTAVKAKPKPASRPPMPVRAANRPALNPSFGRTSGISQMDAIDMRKRAAAQGTKSLSQSKVAKTERTVAEQKYQDKTMPGNKNVATERENRAAAHKKERKWHGRAQPTTLKPAKRGYPVAEKPPMKNVTPKATRKSRKPKAQ